MGDLLICGQQNAWASNEDNPGQGIDKGSWNLETPILSKAQFSIKKSHAEPGNEPETSWSVRNEVTTESYDWIGISFLFWEMLQALIFLLNGNLTYDVV